MTAESGEHPPAAFRPVRAAVALLLRVAPQLRPAVETALWRGFYELASLGGRQTAAALMNYGYAPHAETEQPPAGDGADRYGLALYAAVAGAEDLTGKEVLEVGCGRGGGAAFVFERFSPSTLTGVDLARTAIRRCARRYGRPGLRFQTGDAQRLPFPDARFDAVINVESSHCYPDVAAFLAEVRRVLRPGGVLLLADFRPADNAPTAPGVGGDAATLRKQIAEAGLRVVEEEDITESVLRALSLASPAVSARVRRRVPRALRRHALEFSGVEGSAIFRSFSERTLVYLRFVLERPNGESV